MTMVEILVVLGVLSIISVLMYQILVDMQKENQRVLDEMLGVMALDTGLETLSRDIESILPSPDGKGLFEIRKNQNKNGLQDEILFAVPVAMDESRIGRAERAYAIREDQGGCRLVQFEDNVPDGKVDTTTERAVVRVPKRFSLSFVVEWGKGPDNSWNGKWDPNDGVPERIRVTLTAMRQGGFKERPTQIKLGRTVYLMAM
jgi:type II secretory pathway pseudopilin PulG